MIESDRLIVALLALPLVGGFVYFWGGMLEKKFPEFPLPHFACLAGFLGLSMFFTLSIFQDYPRVTIIIASLLNFLFGWVVSRGILPLFLYVSDSVYQKTPKLPPTPLTFMGSKIGLIRRSPFLILLLLIILWPIALFHSFLPKNKRLPAHTGFQGKFWQYSLSYGLATNILVLLFWGLSPGQSFFTFNSWGAPLFSFFLSVVFSTMIAIGAFMGDDEIDAQQGAQPDAGTGRKLLP
jgi:hypothetical protein